MKNGLKLVIQIPCYNEEDNLTKTIGELPRAIDKIDSIEVIIIDDGSEDKTAEIAAAHPRVSKVVRLGAHKGLATAFKKGVRTALEMGADIIVNTDADGQYPADRISDLVNPIVTGKTEFVIGCRNMDRIKHFSFWKKMAQKMGSCVVSAICGEKIPDVTSGFRAFSRNAAMRINLVVSSYTYTLETLIQLASLNFKIFPVFIDVNPPVRPSRLMKSSLDYIWKASLNIAALFCVYSPHKLFKFLTFLFGLPGLLLIIRFLYYYITRTVLRSVPTGCVQSLTIGVGLFTISFFIFLIGIIAGLISTNRKMIEETLYRLEKGDKRR